MCPAAPDEAVLTAVDGWLAAHRDELVALARALVSLPSENRPPRGDEGPCQEYVAGYLRALGIVPDVFEPDAVQGAIADRAWWPGREYAGRPNVVGRLPGRGGGRSLLFSGHVDVVPALGHGAHDWWAGDVVDGRLYGRGSLDMKGGVACYLHALRCLVACGCELAGDLIVETVVDEEFGGANGTLACRLRGYDADGAVLPEPSGLAVCHATRGGIQYRLHARGDQAGMDFAGGAPASALHAVARASVALADAERERAAPIYQYLLRSGGELPWGTEEGTPIDGALEFWAEIVPGVTREQLEAELHEAVDAATAGGVPITWEQRTRFLPALDGDPASPLATAMRAALRMPDAPPQVAPFACDAFMFAAGAGTPVVVCGPRGDNPHAPDESVVVEDLHTLAAAYVRLALDWCGPGAADAGAP
ncbi:MAG TPA: M20/M25/M40 family metallo-hydrolase [Solirubrobacteraceae bacterium]|jgi:acetylornithine deacetylase|nr:M20/M25/M40 family metallo-hydrolase [Solirubrobacteraceae bacterium]